MDRRSLGAKRRRPALKMIGQMLTLVFLALERDTQSGLCEISCSGLRVAGVVVPCFAAPAVGCSVRKLGKTGSARTFPW